MRSRQLLVALFGALAFAHCEGASDPGDVRVATVASSTAQEGWAVNYPTQRKVFFMAGRLWVFYADGQQMLVRSSADGATFGEPLVVRAGMVFGHRCGFAFDGTFLHYACADALDDGDVFYRRGVPHADGSIEWPLAEQVAFDVPPAHNAMYPKVIVDAGGHPWVSFMVFRGGVQTPPEDAIVTRSSSADGVWNTDVGFPFTLVAGNVTTFPDPVGVALANGGTFWIYNLEGEQPYRGRAWSAAGWAAEERATETASKYALFDAVADGNVVHLSFGGGTVHYRRRDALGQWGHEIDVAGYASGHSSITLRGDDDVLVSWLDGGANQVRQREIHAGTLGPTWSVLDAGSVGLAGMRLGINLNGLVASAGPHNSVVVTSVGSEAPFQIRVAVRGR